MSKNEFIETVKTMIAAPSCCQELKDAGQKWLDAVGTAGENAAWDALLKEAREDICTIEHASLFSNRKWVRRFSVRKKPKRWPPMPATS